MSELQARLSVYALENPEGRETSPEETDQGIKLRRIGMAKRLFVGNLSFQTTEADLSELFSQVGGVDSVKIITDRDTGRSKGFAFVEMSDDSAAEQAIGKFNGSDLSGRNLTVNEARPMEKREFGGGGSRGGGGGGRDRGGYGGRY